MYQDYHSHIKYTVPKTTDVGLKHVDSIKNK
jgi:hypothetical protein